MMIHKQFDVIKTTPHYDQLNKQKNVLTKEKNI